VQLSNHIPSYYYLQKARALLKSFTHVATQLVTQYTDLVPVVGKQYGCAVELAQWVV